MTSSVKLSHAETLLIMPCLNARQRQGQTLIAAGIALAIITAVSLLGGELAGFFGDLRIQLANM